jgi:hypothetical protein
MKRLKKTKNAFSKCVLESLFPLISGLGGSIMSNAPYFTLYSEK